MAERAPVVEPLKVGARLAEELELHLLELAHAEDEVARRDLVAEGLADLADAERQLFARGALYVIAFLSFILFSFVYNFRFKECVLKIVTKHSVKNSKKVKFSWKGGRHF